MSLPKNRYSGVEPGFTSVLRSVITPSCQRKARQLLNVESTQDPLTTSPLLLIPKARLAESPGRVLRSCMLPSLVHRKHEGSYRQLSQIALQHGLGNWWSMGSCSGRPQDYPSQ